MQMIDLLRCNCAIVHLGLPAGNKERRMRFLDHYITSLVLKNGIILGSVNANFANFKTGIAVMEQCRSRFGDVLDRIITHRFPFSEYEKAFSITSENRIKVVLEWE